MRESRKGEKTHLPRSSYETWMEKRVETMRKRHASGGKRARSAGA